MVMHAYIHFFCLRASSFLWFKISYPSSSPSVANQFLLESDCKYVSLLHWGQHVITVQISFLWQSLLGFFCFVMHLIFHSLV